MTTGTRFVNPYTQEISGLGLPYAGGSMFFYASGTSTPQATYSDQACTVPNTNPIILDSNGSIGNVFMPPSNTYKVILNNALGVQIFSIDPVVPAQIPPAVPYPTFMGYTSILTTTSGTFTEATATGRSWKFGTLVCVEITITITTNGSAAGAIEATLPYDSANFVYVLSGRAESGNMLQGYIFANGNTVYIVNYDNTYPGGDGYTLNISGTYEASA